MHSIETVLWILIFSWASDVWYNTFLWGWAATEITAPSRHVVTRFCVVSCGARVFLDIVFLNPITSTKCPSASGEKMRKAITNTPWLTMGLSGGNPILSWGAPVLIVGAVKWIWMTGSIHRIRLNASRWLLHVHYQRILDKPLSMDNLGPLSRKNRVLSVLFTSP